MIKKHAIVFSICMLIFAACSSMDCFGQIKTGTNPSNILPSSILELESTAQAVLFPRLTTAQRDAQTYWVPGDVIMCTSDNCLEYRDTNNIWKCVTATPAPPFSPAALMMGRNVAYANQSTCSNITGIKIASFALQNSSSMEGLRVTSLQITLSGTSPVSNFANLVTSESSGSGSIPQVPGTSNTFSVNFILPPYATKIIDVYADAGSTAGTVVASLVAASSGLITNSTVLQNGTNVPVSGQTITLTNPIFGTPQFSTGASSGAQYIACGTTGVTNASVFVSNFQSTSGASTITELKYGITASTGNPITSVMVNAVTAPVVGSTAYITGLSTVVPNGVGGVNIPAYISYGAVGSSGTPSGTSVSLALTYTKYVGCSIAATTTTTVSGPTMRVVGSKPLLLLGTLPGNPTLTNTSVQAHSVSVIADSHGNIGIDTLVYTLSTSGITSPTFSSPYLYDGTATISTATCTVSGNSVKCFFAPQYVIAGGSTKDLDLYITVGGTIPAGASMVTTLGQSSFKWTDIAGSGTNAAENGQLIWNWPSGGYIIYK